MLRCEFFPGGKVATHNTTIYAIYDEKICTKMRTIMETKLTLRDREREIAKKNEEEEGKQNTNTNPMPRIKYVHSPHIILLLFPIHLGRINKV